MTQLELELLQLVRQWTEDAGNIVAAASEEDPYCIGFGDGFAQAAHELSGFMWDRFCREGDAGSMAGMMYRNDWK